MKGMIVTLVTGSWWQLWSRDKLWSQPAAPAAADQPATTHSDQPAAASHCNSRMILKYQTHQNNLTKSHKKITKNTSILNIMSLIALTKHMSLDNPRYNYYNILRVLVWWVWWWSERLVSRDMSHEQVSCYNTSLHQQFLFTFAPVTDVSAVLIVNDSHIVFIFIRIMQLQNDQYFLRHQNCFLQKYFSRYFV